MRVLVADPLAATGLDYLREHVDVDVRTGLGEAGLAEAIGNYDGLIVRSESKVTARVLDNAARLRVIGRAGVGVDNIDVAAATQRGIIVLNAPSGNTIAAAEQALALMFACARNTPAADRSLRDGKWERAKFIGVELTGSTLGVIGFGKIGQAVAHRGQGLAMHVLAYDPYASAEQAASAGVEMVSLDTLLAQADFITIHTPLVASTRNLIGMAQFRLMKPTACLVNCARGGIVGEADLLAALDEGLLAKAALDVFAQEPPTDPALTSHPKLIVTPHLGASTVQAQTGVALEVARELVAALHDQPVGNAVNLASIPADEAATLRPFVHLAEVLGSFSAQLVSGGYQQVEISYGGTLGEQNTAPLRAAVLRGVLERVTEERVNMVNAVVIAERRGITLVERRGQRSDRYSSLLSVRVTSPNSTHEVAGTVMEGEPHVVQIDGFWLDVVPAGYLLVTHHRDQPGMIGRIGSLMGAANVNISAMHVGRVTPRGEAIMALALDEPIDAAAVQTVLAMPDIYTVQVVDLNRAGVS